MPHAITFTCTCIQKRARLCAQISTVHFSYLFGATHTAFSLLSFNMDHFIKASPHQMKCKYCNCLIKFVNSHSHLSSLKKHLQAKHAEKLEENQPQPKRIKISDFFSNSQSSLPMLPSIDRQAIAACCASHVLPFDIVEDPIFQWAYPCSVTDRKKLSARIQSIASEWRSKIKGMLLLLL